MTTRLRCQPGSTQLPRPSSTCAAETKHESAVPCRAIRHEPRAVAPRRPPAGKRRCPQGYAEGPAVLRCLRPGQICDALLSPTQNPLVRRRLPLLLSHSDNPLAVQGLTTGLDDADWNMQFRCAQALQSLQAPSGTDADRRPGVERRRTRASAQRSDAHSRSDSEKTDPRSRRVALLFHLFGAFYDPEPLELCLRALKSEDRSLQGTAMEYLENLLPAHLWNKLQPALGAAPPAGSKRRSFSSRPGPAARRRHAAPCSQARRHRNGCNQRGSLWQLIHT